MSCGYSNVCGYFWSNSHCRSTFGEGGWARNGCQFLNEYNGRVPSVYNYAIKGSEEKIMAYGVMSMPALVVNEKVVSMGKVLKSKDIVKIFKSI